MRNVASVEVQAQEAGGVQPVGDGGGGGGGGVSGASQREAPAGADATARFRALWARLEAAGKIPPAAAAAAATAGVPAAST